MVKIHSDRIGQQVFSEPRGSTRKQQQVTKFYGTLASGVCLADYVDPQLSSSVDKHLPEERWKENVMLKVQTLKVFFGKL